MIDKEKLNSLNADKKCPEGLSLEEEDAFWMSLAVQLTEQAKQKGEVPVAAIIVKDGELLATGVNSPIENNDPTAHAEVNALRSAGHILENYRLVDTTLYVTLEPCPMCAGAIVHSRVKRVVFGAPDLRTGAAGTVFNLLDSDLLNHRCEIVSGVREDECAHILKSFFKERRMQKKCKK